MAITWTALVVSPASTKNSIESPGFTTTLLSTSATVAPPATVPLHIWTATPPVRTWRQHRVASVDRLVIDQRRTTAVLSGGTVNSVVITLMPGSLT